MGKFGIGARVRDREGDEGVITAKRKGERLVKYDDTDYGSIWNAKERLTALEVVANDNEFSACAPVFEKEYSVGDRVRVKTRDYGEKQFGKTGVVVEVKRPSSLPIEIEYDEPLTPGGLKRNQYKPEDLEPTEPAVAPATPTFAKGDHALSQNGDYVTVDTDPDEVDHVWVSFGTTKWRTPVSWLSKWEPRAGDRVKLVKDGTSTTGAVGKIATLEAWADGDFIDGEQYLLNIDGPVDYETRAVDQRYTRATIDCFEPLPVAEQPAAEPTDTRADAGGGFKAGDRVRLISGELPLMPIGTEVVAVARTSGAESSVHYVGVDGHTTWRPGSYFELVTPAAELWAPVAGKYGKTRDGRKARVEKADNCEYPFRAGGNHYNADGSHFYGEANKDLVAEWVEPVAEPEAEPTKYKVGDEVLLRGGSTAKIIDVRTPGQIQSGSFPFVHDGGDGSWHAVDADGRSCIGKAALDIVSKVEPAAPPAEFKVGDRVRIVKNNRPDQKHLNEEIGKEFTITTADGPNDVGWSGATSENDYWWEESELELVSSAPTTSTLPIGSTVTFTATGRLSAINDNGHMQVTFPDLAPAQNSFALPAKYVALAN